MEKQNIFWSIFLEIQVIRQRIQHTLTLLHEYLIRAGMGAEKRHQVLAL